EKLKERGHPQPLSVAPQAHAAVESALEDGEPAVGLNADQKEFPGLVGGECEADTLLGQPVGKLAGGVDFQLRLGWRHGQSLVARSFRKAASILRANADPSPSGDARNCCRN